MKLAIAGDSAGAPLAKVLAEAGFTPTVIHRNLGSRAADLVEGKH